MQMFASTVCSDQTKCSEDFIASISGHRDYREIRTYMQAANNARMATEGMARVLEMFPAAKVEK